MATDSGVGYFYADSVDTDLVRYWDRGKIHFFKKNHLIPGCDLLN